MQLSPLYNQWVEWFNILIVMRVYRMWFNINRLVDEHTVNTVYHNVTYLDHCDEQTKSGQNDDHILSLAENQLAARHGVRRSEAQVSCLQAGIHLHVRVATTFECWETRGEEKEKGKGKKGVRGRGEEKRRMRKGWEEEEERRKEERRGEEISYSGITSTTKHEEPRGVRSIRCCGITSTLRTLLEFASSSSSTSRAQPLWPYHQDSFYI